MECYLCKKEAAVEEILTIGQVGVSVCHSCTRELLELALEALGPVQAHLIYDKYIRKIKEESRAPDFTVPPHVKGKMADYQFRMRSSQNG